MSTTLEPQIRDLSRAFEAAIDPVTVDEIFADIETAVDVPARSRRPVWVAAVAIAAIVLAPLIIIASVWLSEEAAEDITPTTIDEATTTTIEATTTTLDSDVEQPVVPVVGVAGLPVGWTVAELTLEPSDGRTVFGYGAKGVPWVMTHGLHCQDESGVARLTQPANLGNMELCRGDAVEYPIATLYRGQADGWAETVDPFDGNPSHPVQRLANLASVVVCAVGEPLPFEPDNCEALVSVDGTDWYTPVLVDESGMVIPGTDDSLLAEALWSIVYSPYWHRIGDQILVAVPDGGGGLHTPDSVIWFYSPDAGRSFVSIGSERARYSSDWGNILSFVYRDRFRSINWDDEGNALVRELSDDLKWRPVGPVLGLPVPEDEWTPGDAPGSHSAQGTKTGTVYLMNMDFNEPKQGPIRFISADGGETWTEPAPTGDLPFTSAGDAYVGGPGYWFSNIDGWLLMSTNRGLLLTDGRAWYPLDEEVFLDSEVIDRRVSGSTTIRVPVPPLP